MSQIPFEFILFGCIIIGIAVSHKHATTIALAGLAVIVFYKIFFQHFSFSEHLTGTDHHEGEWKVLLNLFGLLTGFAVLARHFEQSNIPQHMPNLLPDDWRGGFVLLIIIFIFSSFLDNIAATLIGGAVARVVFKNKVHIGYIAAIVAAANAGGAGSVLGDTTTTMMWISGLKPIEVLHGFIGSGVALLVFGIPASIQQDRYQRIMKDDVPGVKINFGNVMVVIAILLAAIVANIYFNAPALGVWVVIFSSMLFVKTDWSEMPAAIKGSIFLLSLVMAASLMPVDQLPKASSLTTGYLGLVSSVFDNIPLTKLALQQGGYDWGLLAFSVGFGGSMIWFGSSAGVAITNLYPESRSAWQWLKSGWHVVIAFFAGFGAMILFA